MLYLFTRYWVGSLRQTLFSGQTLDYEKLLCNLTAEFSFPDLALFLQLSTLLNIQFRDGFLSIKYSKC